MRISHKYKFVFLSNPQCGSTTVRKFLNPYSDIISTKKYPYNHHINAKKLYAHFLEKQWIWESYTTITTIRNPWARMVSRYHYGMCHPESIWHNPAKTASNFISFMQNEKMLSITKIKSPIESFGGGIQNKKSLLINHVIPLEKIDLLLPPLLAQIGIINVPSTFEKINSSPHQHYSTYYDDNTINVVAEIFQSDIVMGNYHFESQ